MSGNRDIGTHLFIFFILFIVLGYAEDRDIWLVQVMGQDLYESNVAMQAHSQAPIEPLEYVAHTMVFGPTNLDTTLSINAFVDNGAVGPSVTYWAEDTDADFLTQTGSRGTMFQYVTHLGRQSITNEAIYDAHQFGERGPYVSTGIVSDMWAGIEGTASAGVEEIRGVDPTISNFILNLFQRVRGDLNGGFPGLAGRIFDAYAGYRSATPTFYTAYSSNPSIEITRVDPYARRMVNAVDSGRTIGLARLGIALPGVSATDIEFPDSNDIEYSDSGSEYGAYSDAAADQREVDFLRQSSVESTQSWRIGVGHYETEAEAEASIANDLADFQDLDLCSDTSGTTAKRLRKRSSSCSATNNNKLQNFQGEMSTVEIRIEGKLQEFTSFAGRTLTIAGYLGDAALPIFIILDIVEGQWKAAAWALGAAAAGVAADALASSAAEIIGAFAVAGPIGLFVGAAVALLFTILPGLFEKKNEPLTTNTTEILQWAFFGDAKHTGNEKCNQGLENNDQTPNCTVVYGPGTLSAITKWEIFDASVFLINMNLGYAMSIPDMASNFTVYDYTDPAASANASAVIDCGQSLCPDPSTNPVTTWNAEPAQIPCAVSDAYKCTHPKFRLNRTLITLPIINQTANNTYNQVQSGECKIVSDPVEGEVLYPPAQNGTYGQNNASVIAQINSAAAATTQRLQQLNYTSPAFNNSKSTNLTTQSNPVSNGTAMLGQNQTSMSALSGPWSSSPGQPMNYTGKPVSIACNLLADVPDVLSPTYNTSRASLYPLANTSTSGDDSFFVPPPSPLPFTALDPKSAVCLSNSKSPQNLLCLPNGTFPTCQGAFGYSTKSIDTVSFYSAGSNLTLNIEQILDSEGNDVTPETFFENNSTADDELRNSMSTATSRKESFTVAIPGNIKPPPTMCIYSAVEYSGDVWCMGPGGMNFTSNLVNKAASLTLTEGLAAWIYPKYYGNPLGMQVSTSVADLTSIPYLTNSNFKGNIAAAWIYNASTTII